MIKITIDDKEVKTLLQNLSRKVSNMSPLMRNIAGIMHNAVEENFEQQGRPVGYDIFAGNTFDGKTLEPFLLRLKERFSIQRIIIVADRGINSKMNLMRLKELGYGYIVACMLKGMSKEIKE